MAGIQRTLQVCFADAKAFEQEYAANLAKGGVFVSSDEAFELREHVRVELLLESHGKSVTLGGEVVHVLTPELAQIGGSPGVAVQFEGAVSAVRGQLEPLRLAAGAPAHQTSDSGKRRSPRMEARVAAQIDAEDGPVAGLTRNLSQNGVLISVPGRDLSLGEKVRLSLTHPGSGESMEVDGVIVRQEQSDGVASAVAIDFAPDDGEAAGLHEFVAQIQASEHTRRLGGIAGDVAELGVQNVLQMFATTAQGGTLTLRDGAREGVVGFEQGLLRFVRVGSVSGMKALVRLIGWKSGSFEFHSGLDPVDSSGPSLPFDAALLQALTMLDEEQHAGPRDFDPELVPRIVADVADLELSKIEAAVLDLVQAGFTVARMVAVIPEPDPEVRRALESLCDQGVLDV